MESKWSERFAYCARLAGVAALAAAMLFSAGCGKDGAENVGGADAEPASEASGQEPVTLKIYNYNAGIVSEQNMQEVFAKPVQAKYPNIKFELVSGAKLDQLIATGDVPDLIASSNYYMNDLLQLGLPSDLNDLVKKYKTDLSRITPGTLQVMAQFAKNGELYAMPYAMNYGVMVYNKDIFDKFAAPYPTDRMTWDQVIELARKVTKSDNGVQYVGLDPGSPQQLTRAYSLPTVDEKQEKAILTSEPYKKVFEWFRQIYDIPGIVGENNKYSYGIDFFLKDKKLAMLPYWIANLTSRLPAWIDSGSTFNWDIVSFPSFPDKPGFGREFDFHLLIIPTTSKHREAAYRVIETMISEEAQKMLNKGTRLTVLNDPELRKQHASDLKIYEGKNLAGIFKVEPAPVPVSTVYDTQIYGILGDAIKTMVKDKTDVNTALRTANDKADKLIQEKKAEMSQ